MSTRIMPISDLRRKTSDVLNIVQETGDPVYITQHGRPVVVILAYEHYEQLLAQLAALTPTPDELLLSTPDNDPVGRT